MTIVTTAARATLDQLLAAKIAEHEAATRRVELVCELRNAHGWTWGEIGNVLGISKQGAAKVYAQVSEQSFRASMKRDRQASTAAKATKTAAPRTIAEARPSSPVAAPAVDIPLDLPATSSDTQTTEVVSTAELAKRWAEHEELQQALGNVWRGEERGPFVEQPKTGAHAVECPSCGAEPGERCATDSGLWSKKPHGTRTRRAKAEAQG